MVSNGEIVVDNMDQHLKNMTHINPNCLPNLYIMRKSTFNKSIKTESLFGKMTDFNIWNKSFGIMKMVEWTRCNLKEDGNIVAWNKSEWEIVDLDLEEADENDVCQTHIPGLQSFPFPRNYEASENICKRLHGKIAIGKNENDIEKFKKNCQGKE